MKAEPNGLLFDDPLAVEAERSSCPWSSEGCDPERRAQYEADRARWLSMPIPTGRSPEKSHRQFFLDNLPPAAADQPTSPISHQGSRWVDLRHVDQFIEDECEQSPYGERMKALYEAYCSWATAHHHDVAEIGPFIWKLRQTFDSCALGHRAGGGWIVGVRLRRDAGFNDVAPMLLVEAMSS